VSIINSGKECLDAAKNGNGIDIVILGTHLPDISVLDLIKKIRDDSDVPVIFLSDDKGTSMLVSALEAGANDYIVKPFNKPIFIARLEALIRRSMWDSQAIENRLNYAQPRCNQN
jgi:DNA-binding response OmpR family regulator